MKSNDEEPMTVSEAQVLYLYHARAAFNIEMQDYISYEDRKKSKEHDELASRYARMLREVGVAVEDAHGDTALQLAAAHTRTWSVLYSERQQLPGGIS